ncbi:hypothetical protein ACP4OV_011039 [Aristida adscensionis]
MAARTGSSSPAVPRRFWSMLSYALSELCVIILLHVAAAASYAATRLARICSLKAPCTLCSRLDHDLHGKPWFSSDLICAAHRTEISSLAYCSSHSQLACSDDLCNRCLLASGYSSLGVSEGVNSRSRSRSRRLCSCCSEKFNSDRNAERVSEAGNAVECSEETNRRSQVEPSDRNISMVAKNAPEQGPADHTKDKTFEEVNESDGSPGKYEQCSKANAGTAKRLSSRSAAPSRIFVDRNSSVKNTFLGRINLPSPRPSEIISARDNNSTTQQEVKALLTQMSCARGLDSCSSEGASSLSPGSNIQTDESSGHGRRPSLERNYSVLEPSYGNLDDVEGESSIDNVKKQLDLNKQAMSALYKELDEERSASAIAASQAMAMINKLHEEKAAMQMEALQYLRMMEEQADHDHQAIQDLHDLLTDREKELLDMDAELENCRRLLEDKPFNGGSLFDATGTMSGTGDNENGGLGFLNMDFVRSTMSDFEDEKAHILESLCRLEERLCSSTNRLVEDDARNRQEGTLLGGRTRDGLDMDNALDENYNRKCPFSPSANNKMVDIASLQNEIWLLNTRLKALEDDQMFLKQILSSLQCGDDGLQCVQEITRHLVELRRGLSLTL